MNRRWTAAAACMLACFAMTVSGCGKKADSSVNAVSFSKNGEMTVTSVEPFDQNKYSKDELQKKIGTDLKAYDSSGSAVRMDSLSVSKNSARLVMRYASAGDYAKFNDTGCFFGTISDANLEGKDLSRLLSEPSRENTEKILTNSDIETMGSNHLIILQEQTAVSTPWKILYSTENVKVSDDTHAEITEDVSASEPAMLILTK